MRESGYYWVKINNEWQPAEFNERSNTWSVIGYDSDGTWDFNPDEIGTKIEKP